MYSWVKRIKTFYKNICFINTSYKYFGQNEANLIILGRIWKHSLSQLALIFHNMARKANYLLKSTGSYFRGHFLTRDCTVLRTGIKNISALNREFLKFGFLHSKSKKLGENYIEKKEWLSYRLCLVTDGDFFYKSHHSLLLY